MGINEEAEQRRAAHRAWAQEARSARPAADKPKNESEDIRALLLEYRDYAVLNGIPPTHGRLKSTRVWVLVDSYSAPSDGGKTGHKRHAAVWQSGRVAVTDVPYDEIRREIVRKVAYRAPWTGTL